MNVFDKYTLITCSYNTPEVTLMMLKSFVYHHGPGPFKLLLIENSTSPETQNLLKENNVPFIVHTENKCHGPSLNFAISKCKTNYALIVDTDIIFKKPVYDILKYNEANKCSAVGKISGNRGGKWISPRLDPWFLIINTQLTNNNNISFYRYIKHNGLITYDIGSSFVLDLKKIKDSVVVSVGNIEEFFTHFEGTSWWTNRFSKNGPYGDIDIDENAMHGDEFLYKKGQENIVKYKQLISESLFREIDISKAFITGE